MTYQPFLILLFSLFKGWGQLHSNSHILCILKGKQVEETLENAQWRKVKHMQSLFTICPRSSVREGTSPDPIAVPFWAKLAAVAGLRKEKENVILFGNSFKWGLA